jgi:Inward rectifier potassium channel C-terminal domain
LFAFLFARIGRAEARGIQVIFSNKAIISHQHKVPYPCFQFRVFDVDGKHPVVESHVRIYAVTQMSAIPIPLRIVIPNDELGGMLYLSLPSQVVHAMDAYSPLLPPSTSPEDLASTRVPRVGLNLRQVDSSTNSREEVCCPVCGESYGTYERLIKHGKFQKLVETHDGVPLKGSHRELDWEELASLFEVSATWSLDELKAFFKSNISEILCVVEGIDPLSSGTFQALQSYQIDDIHFGEAHFADCVCLSEQGNLVVDLEHFHKINDQPAERTGEGELKTEETMQKAPSAHLSLRRVSTPEGGVDNPAKPTYDATNSSEPRPLEYDSKPSAQSKPQQQLPFGDLVCPPAE